MSAFAFEAAHPRGVAERARHVRRGRADARSPFADENLRRAVAVALVIHEGLATPFPLRSGSNAHQSHLACGFSTGVVAMICSCGLLGFDGVVKLRIASVIAARNDQIHLRCRSPHNAV